MRERHPHLYGDGERREWEEMKASKRESIADGLPAALPTLHRAYRLQERAAGVGFDWDDTEGPARKVEEELAEVRGELAQQGDVGARRRRARAGASRGRAGRPALRRASISAGAPACIPRSRSTAPPTSSRAASRRVEALARERGIAIGDAGIAALDALWNEVKLAE